MRSSARDYPRVPSYAISQDEKTSLKDALAGAAAENNGLSGFRVFEKGSESLMARLALVRLAEKSVDLQYYGIGSDVSSKLMMESIIQAAGRGVRVRLLIDAITVKEMEDVLLGVNGVENLEVRIFNPMQTEDQPLPSKLIGMVTDLPKANRRMHNKAMIADNQMAILGGRNLSDQYFEADTDYNFRDIDVLAAGPIVPDISQSFDQYWNGTDTFPVAAVFEPDVKDQKIVEIRHDLRKVWDSEIRKPERRMQLIASIKEVMAAPEFKMEWAKAELAADHPSKIRKEQSYTESQPLDHLLSLLDNAQHEFIAISPYFVPTDKGVEWLGNFEAQGVEVKVLTNSLASNDVVATHSGYAPYRKPLLQKGVQLYELMAVNGERAEQRLTGSSQPPRAGLHSKLYIVDGAHVLIGSFNLDPRSVNINTEVALVIHSPQIAAQMKRFFERAIAPNVSYQLSLDGKGDIVWRGIEKGRPMIYKGEPHGGFWRKLQSRVVGVLPIEDQL